MFLFFIYIVKIFVMNFSANVYKNLKLTHDWI